MKTEPDFIDAKIMGREYRIACGAGERDALVAAVELVDGKMREIAQRTRNTVAERVAVMAALNIAHDHLAAPRGEEKNSDLSAIATSEAKRRISAMGARLDAVLAPQQQLEQ